LSYCEPNMAIMCFVSDFCSDFGAFHEMRG
jgi:hypothetical protein